MFTVKKFHTYLYGRVFTITTGHKPLISLFGEAKAVPALASSCIQRWALTLATYQYTIVYRPGLENQSADAMSRLPLESGTTTDAYEEGNQVLQVNYLTNNPVTAKAVRKWTRGSPAEPHLPIRHGGVAKIGRGSQFAIFRRRHELTTQNGCLLRGNRVVVPPEGRKMVLEELHEAHPGVVRMKALARNYVWWPGIDKELEETVRRCETCQRHARNPPGAPLHPWEFPAKPWSRLHVDYAGSFLGKMFLLVIDAFSKWLDVYMVQSATSQTTIDKLRVSFAIHGLPDVIVSDNGSCFTSGDFEAFCHCQGIIHTKSAPYHPATNGLAERAVQTFKQSMKKLHPGSLEERLQTFLMYYRNTPHATTERTPAELLLGRSPKTVLDLIKPDLSGKVMKKQVLQKSYHDKTSRDRQFQLGEAVYVRNFGRGGVWMPATISQILIGTGVIRLYYNTGQTSQTSRGSH